MYFANLSIPESKETDVNIPRVSRQLWEGSHFQLHNEEVFIKSAPFLYLASLVLFTCFGIEELTFFDRILKVLLGASEVSTVAILLHYHRVVGSIIPQPNP
jgi:hypothetical protein